MLSLDSSRWRDLEQAYGTAEDVPRLLESLGTERSNEARAAIWFSLWRLLFRGRAVLDAAYASAPHLLRIAAPLPLRERVEGVHLVTRIEILRHEAGAPAIPRDLVESYADAIESLPAQVTASLGEPWDDEVAQVLAAALVIGKRQPGLAASILELGARTAEPSV